MESLSLSAIARELAADLWSGSYVNLGIGLPGLVADHLTEDCGVTLHCENGVLGFGPPAEPGAEDWDLIDASKRPITLRPGGAFMNHADSFGLIRGGHLDVAVMGAFEVSSGGDLANWSTGGGIPAVGGAMDLAVGAKTVWVLMRHTTAEGSLKLGRECTLPITGRAVVSRVYTEYGIFEPSGDSFTVLRLCDGVDLERVSALTGAPLRASSDEDLPRRQPGMA